MQIRKYRSTDRESLIRLWNEVFPGSAPHNEPGLTIDKKTAVDDLILVAEESNELIGSCMAGYDGHRGWLYAVAVSAKHRRRGVGSALIRNAIEALRALGCMKVNLQIRADNSEVVRFYEALGFAVEERVSMGMLIDRMSAFSFSEDSRTGS